MNRTLAIVLAAGIFGGVVLSASALAAAQPENAGAPAKPPAAAVGEGVVLRPAYRAGETFVMAFTLKGANMTADAGGNPTGELRVSQQGTLRVNILDVDEAGVATVSAVIATMDLRTEVRVEGQDPDVRQVGFRHAEGEEAAGEDAAEEAAAAEEVDDPDPVRSVAERMSKAVIRFEAMPDGRARRITGVEALGEAAGDSGIAQMAMGPFAPGSIKRMLERIWVLDEPVEGEWRARSPGDEWTMMELRPIGAQSATTQRMMTLNGLGASENLHEVSFTVRGQLMPRRGDAEPTEPTLKLNEWTEEGTAVWDAAAGRILRRSEKATTDVTATLGDRSRRSRLVFELELGPVKPEDVR